MAFCQAVQELHLPTACYAIDTWQGDEHAGFYDSGVFARLNAEHQANYGAFSQLIRARFDEALATFGDGTIDLLHIDGRHLYEDVVEDYTSWLPKLSAHGVVLFHDIEVRERNFGVWKFWEEVRARHPSFSFLHGHGLGVLCPGDVPDGLAALFAAGSSEQVAIREIYSRLGAAVSTAYQAAVHHADLTHTREQLRHATTEIERRNEDVDRLAAKVDEQEAISQDGLELIQRSAISAREIADLALGGEVADAAATPVSAAPVDALPAALDTLHTAVEQQRDELTRAQERVDELQSLAMRHGVAAQQLDELQRSGIWRGFVAVRSFAMQVPAPVRSKLRRVLKAAWWAATPHRMPERIRFLRMRRAESAGMSRGESRVTYPAGRFLNYTPSEATSTSTAAGSYRFADRPQSYVYVPPRRPDDIAEKIAAWGTHPVFSIVVPLYNTSDALFDAMYESVRGQWYPHWQLILIDDKSPSPNVRERLARVDDPRVKILALDTNRGIAGATNAGLDEASGDYIVFLDHDDELTDDCLFELAQCVNRDDPDYIYSDEDKIETDGTFGQPFFKPDWSPDTLMSTMYTCHVSCVRRSLQREIGGLRPEYDGSQDWDFVLRVTERAKRISHVRKVLYHWRVIPASVASDLQAKPYAIDAGRRARIDALKRRGLVGTLEPVLQLPGYFRTRYAPVGQPLVSIVIPSKNNGKVLETCLTSIRSKTRYPNVEIVLIDNGSTDADTLHRIDTLASSLDIKVVRHDAPFNYSELNNLGVRAALGEYLVFLNDDTEVLAASWLDDMLGFAQLEHIGAVGAKLLYPEGRRVQHAGIVNLADGPNHAFQMDSADAPGYFARNLLEYNWIGVTGACLMTSREKFDRIGGFDEALPVAYNDVDLCFRFAEAGLFNVVCQSVELLHYESMSRGRDDIKPEKIARLAQDKAQLYLKHPNFYMFDPFHNPNLDQLDIHFAASAP